METNTFIGSSEDSTGHYRPSRPNSSQRSHMKCYILVVLLILLTAGISAGITFYCVQLQLVSTRINNHINTTRKWTRNIKGNHNYEYEVFTVPKYGNYSIVGLIWAEETEEKQRDESNHYIWLHKKLISDDEIAKTTFRCKLAILECELQNVKENSKIYVKFNLAKPDTNKTVFHIYEL